MSEIGSLFAAGTLLSLGGLGLYLYQSNDDDETKENIELKVDDEESEPVVEDEAPVRSKTRKTKVIRRTSKQTSTRRRY
jgi:hypothetical protein